MSLRKLRILSVIKPYLTIAQRGEALRIERVVRNVDWETKDWHAKGALLCAHWKYFGRGMCGR